MLLEAKKYRFGAVAILPSAIPLAREVLKGSGVKIVAAIGFPLGTIPPELKIDEAEKAIKDGADELDVVMNKGALKQGKIEDVKKEIKGIVNLADGKVVKVIIEVPYLNRKEIELACNLIIGCGAHFVKTSTGFKGFHKWRPTTVDDIKLIKSIVKDRIRIKASGGIRTAGQALAVIGAGADRIGTSSGVQIIEGYRRMMGVNSNEC